ncbi:hypothetical protein LINGRAHAP2_LOCUS31997, partial [Linum grandiflorum]
NVSAQELRSLIQENPRSEEQIQAIDLDLEDIYDESLLPVESFSELEEKAYPCKLWTVRCLTSTFALNWLMNKIPS